MKTRISILICGLLSTCKIFAATPLEPLALASVGETDYFAELPVVLSVTRLEQPTREAPGTVSVITAEEIRSSGAQDLADLLRMLPGFQVADTSMGAPIAVYHGLTSASIGRMQVLVDGRTQYSPLWFGGVNWTALQVSLPDIERIEVVRGSNSAAFGANAVQGIVNIKTFSARNDASGQLNLKEGSNGIEETYLSKSWKVDQDAYRVSMERRRTNGLKNFPDSRFTERFSLKAELQPTTNDEVVLSLGGVRTRQGIGYYPEPSTWLGDEPPHERTLENYYAQIDWHRHLSGGDSVAVRAFHLGEKGRETYTGVFDYINNVTYELRGDNKGDITANYDYAPNVTRDEIEVQYTAQLGDTARAVVGLGARHDVVEDKQFYAVARQEVKLYRGFAHGEWRAHPDWLLSLGGTVEKDAISGSSAAPRLAANWFVAPGQTLRFVSARAYRTPSLFEQKADVRVTDTTGILETLTGSNVFPETKALNPLSPEQLTAIELGYLGEWKAEGLSLDVRAFNEKLKDVVAVYGGYPDFPAENIRINGMAVTVKGAEAQLRWNPVPGTRFWINHSVLNIKAEMGEMPVGYILKSWNGIANDYAENSAPEKQYSVHWWQTLPGGLNSSLAWYKVGSYRWTRNTSVPSYHRVDWRLAYPFRHGDDKGEIALTVRANGNDHAEYRYGTFPATYNKQLVSTVGIVSLNLGF